MTKYLDYAFLSVALLAALPACTSASSEADEPDSATELKFAAVEQTRASVTSNTTLTDKPFAVYGDMVLSASSNNPTLIFNGTQVTHNGTSWNYDQPQYWFPGHTYSFGAVHPAESSCVSDISFENSALTLTYNYPGNYKDAVDLLTSVHRRSYTYGTGHLVTFNFRHALARMNFTVKVDQAIHTPITITHLSFKNIGLSSSYTVASASMADNEETDDYVGHSWSQPTDQTAVLFDIDEHVTINQGETYEFFNASENPLMLIPQPVSEKAEIEITYYKGDDSENTITATAKIFVTTATAHNGTWLPGRSYTYSFSIGATDLILFGVPTVKEWRDEEGGNYVITN